MGSQWVDQVHKKLNQIKECQLNLLVEAPSHAIYLIRYWTLSPLGWCTGYKVELNGKLLII